LIVVATFNTDCKTTWS